MRKLLALFALLLGSATASAQTITAAGDPWPPFLDPNDPQQGVAIELVRQALATQGHQLEFSFVPWQRALDGVKDGEYDVLVSAWKTLDRETFLQFSEPYLHNEIKFIKAKGSAFDYSGLDSLSGKSVGTVRGYGYGDAFEQANNFKREEAAALMPSILKVIDGRIDLTLEDEVVAKSLMSKENPELLEKIEFAATPLSSNGLHVASGLKNAKHAEIIEAFNKGLETIKANGTFDATLQRYGVK